MATTLITDTHASILKAARTVLEEIEENARKAQYDEDLEDGVSAWDLGKLSEAADHAEEAIFNALNTANSYCGTKVDL